MKLQQAPIKDICCLQKAINWQKRGFVLFCQSRSFSESLSGDGIYEQNGQAGGNKRGSKAWKRGTGLQADRRKRQKRTKVLFTV